MAVLGLQVKPFGKDGIRLCWNRGDCREEICVEHLVGDTWSVFSDPLPADPEGVIVVKRSSQQPAPRSLVWRLRGLTQNTSPVILPCAHGPASSSRLATLQDLYDVEMLFNVLQWYSTLVVDWRTNAEDRERFAESIICPDLSTVAGIPFKDDAVCLQVPTEIVEALRTRMFRSVQVLSPLAAAQLLDTHPYLSADGPDGVLRKRPVFPNLIDGSLLLGHQGHARTLPNWASLLGVVGVINLAPDKVPSLPSALAEEHRQHYLDVFHHDGLPLKDTYGQEEGQRLLQLLPRVLGALTAALAHGRVFVHCQQGRSRSASVVVAHLLVSRPQWSLFDALHFVTHRRPEVELNISYAEALETWAVGDLGRDPSLAAIQERLAAHIRQGSDVACGAPARS